MRYINYLDFSMYHIKLFLSLAENLNYTKTADKCGVTQSSLSRIIMQLESMLGIQLFIRNTSKVILTPAGKSLYKDFENLYGNIEHAVQKAYRIQKGKSRPLNIGVSDGMDINVELMPFLQTFQQKYPNFEINFIRDYDHTLMKKLRQHTYDVVFDFTLKEIDDPFINEKSLFSGPLMLYMLKSNPLCQKEILTLSDLQSQRILIRAPSLEPVGMEIIHKLFTTQNIEPRFSTFVANAQDMYLNLRENNQVILADRYFLDRYSPILCAKPIKDTKSTVWIRWMKEFEEDRDTDLFVGELLEHFDLQKEADND